MDFNGRLFIEISSHNLSRVVELLCSSGRLGSTDDP